MTQISRPFQIALVAMGLFAAVWFVALRGHSASTGSESSPAAASAQPQASPASPAAASPPSSVYHGSAPGVEGLSRAIAKAHGAVTESQQNAKQLQEKSAQASSNTSSTPTASAVTAPTKVAVAPRATAKPTVTHKAAATGAATPVTGPNRVPAKQALVEQELKQGAVAVVLFWSPKGADDVAVRHELQLLVAIHHGLRSVAKVPVVRRLLKAVGFELDRKIAVQEASASQVASFGTITRAVQVTGTPTILIINKRGKTTTLTGLTDAYSIEQAINEARHT